MEKSKEFLGYKKRAMKYGIRLGLKTDDDGRTTIIFADKKGRWFGLPYEAITEAVLPRGAVDTYAKDFNKQYEGRVGQYIE